jgi:hypothetical protein
MVVQALIAPNSQEQEALADPLAVVQEIAPAGPYAFHRVTVPTCPVQATTSILTRTMIDRPLVIVSLGAMIDMVSLSEALRPALHLGNDERFDRCGVPILQNIQRDLDGWCVRVCLVAALHQAQ